MSNQCKDCECKDKIIEYKDEQINGLLRTIHTLSEANKELSKKLPGSLHSSEAREELEELLLRHTPEPPSTPVGTPEKRPRFPFPKPQFPGGKPPSDPIGKRTPKVSKNPAKNPKEPDTNKDSGTPSINGQQCVACGLYQQSKNIRKHFRSTHSKEYGGPYWIKPVTRKKLMTSPKSSKGQPQRVQEVEKSRQGVLPEWQRL